MAKPRILRPAVLRFSVALGALLLLICTGMLAQTTGSTGSIVGTVTDPSDAVLSGAKVSIVNTATGRAFDLTTNSAGAYASGALAPGTYKVQISVKGFNSVSVTPTSMVRHAPPAHEN